VRAADLTERFFGAEIEGHEYLTVRWRNQPRWMSQWAK
jgi:hypothetical protein